MTLDIRPHLNPEITDQVRDNSLVESALRSMSLQSEQQ